MSMSSIGLVYLMITIKSSTMYVNKQAKRLGCNGIVQYNKLYWSCIFNDYNK